MAADWFHKLGFTLPYGTNVADFILDLASGAILTDGRWACAPSPSGPLTLACLSGPVMASLVACCCTCAR